MRIESLAAQLQQAQREDGYWEAAASRPRGSDQLTRHRIIYTTQVLRFLGELGCSDAIVIERAVSFLLEAKVGVPLYDSALKVLAFCSVGKAELASDFLGEALRSVDNRTGVVELGRRRHAGLFDALFLLEGAVMVSAQGADSGVEAKANRLMAALNRISVDGYRVTADPSFWAWYVTLQSRYGRAVRPAVVARLCEALLAARNSHGVWSPPRPAEPPTAIAPVHGDILQTAHTLINLVEIARLVPSEYQNELLEAPLDWLAECCTSAGWVSLAGKPDPYLTSLALRTSIRSAVLLESRFARKVANWLTLANVDSVVPRVRAAVLFDRRKRMKKVFIVHGHDGGAKHGLARLLEKEFELEPIILHEQPNYGAQALLDKFEASAGECEVAFVLLTPDDRVIDAGESHDRVEVLRSRQNVIFEMGYFIAKLGRERVFLLHRGQVEIPSDISGIMYIRFDSIEDAYLALKRELKALGLA